MTCDFKFCRFCGHGDKCSANGHQRSQCKYKRLQEANNTAQDEVRPWPVYRVGDFDQDGEVNFRPQFMYARPDTTYGVTTGTADTTYGVTAGTAGTTATHTARNLDLGF